MTSGCLWNYHRDEMNDEANENNSNNNRINNNKTITSKSFEYKKKLIGSQPSDKDTLDRNYSIKIFASFLGIS